MNIVVRLIDSLPCRLLLKFLGGIIRVYEPNSHGTARISLEGGLEWWSNG